MALQQRVLNNALGALTDPRFHELLGDFYALRGHLTIGDRPVLDRALAGFLDIMGVILGDQHTLRVAEGADEQITSDVADAAACVGQVKELVAGPAFEDAATVLFLLCRKLKWEGGGHDTPEVVLARVDDFLQLLGLGASVSVAALWRDVATVELATSHREALWTAVSGLLTAVVRECGCAAVV
jgi:hypothetical protein